MNLSDLPNAYRGTWNVPFITNCYLMKISVFRTSMAKPVTYSKEEVDPDMAFCASLREVVRVLPILFL